MMTSENLIFFVYSRPELWDQSNKNYSRKDLKLKAWNFIAEKMNLSVNQAKVRWTNLRDLFRRELKKAVKMAKMTGDAESYVPRWRYFKSLLFLKDQMIKDEDIELPYYFDNSIAKHYPQIILEDEDSNGESEYLIDYTQSSASNGNLLPISSNKKYPGSVNNADRPSHDTSERYGKRQRFEESSFINESEGYPSFVSSTHNEADEDYHFVMSILPSIRRICPDRKTSFKMKILQLIMEEEKCLQA